MQNILWRRFWHLLGGSFIPILALFIPRENLLIIIGAISFIFFVFDIFRFISPDMNRKISAYLGVMMKRKKGSLLTGTTYLLISSLAVFLFFDKYIAVTSLFFLSVGDFAAAIIGGKFGILRMYDKSIEGSIACMISCLVIGIVMTWVSPVIVLPVVILGAVSATIIELMPVPIDDNLTIPLFSAGVMTITINYI